MTCVPFPIPSDIFFVVISSASCIIVHLQIRNVIISGEFLQMSTSAIMLR